MLLSLPPERRGCPGEAEATRTLYPVTGRDLAICCPVNGDDRQEPGRAGGGSSSPQQHTGGVLQQKAAPSSDIPGSQVSGETSVSLAPLSRGLPTSHSLGPR